jgi:hypothetical protein
MRMMRTISRRTMVLQRDEVGCGVAHAACSLPTLAWPLLDESHEQLLQPVGLVAHRGHHDAVRGQRREQ